MVDHSNPNVGEPSQQAEATTSQDHGSQKTENLRRGSVDTTQTRRASTDSTSSQLSSRSQRDSLRHRIFHLSELLRVEKANRDDNTSCYVELVSKADREKAPSIRQAFERINQRSSANIAHLEQRLQESLSQLRKIEQRTPPLLGQDNPTVVQQPSSSPRGSWDFLRHPTLSKFRIRSAENASIDELNLPALTESKEEGLVPEAVPKPFLDEASQQRLQELKTQLENIRADYKALEDEWQKLEAAWKGDKQQMMEHLQEEKKRHYHLEVQVNDLIQLNLCEITNLKQDLACTEEKMVYQSYERSRDIWEVLESYQTRLTRLETQQQTQQQEAMELPQSSVYKLYGQLMNLLLTIATIVLVCVSTISAFTLPFLRTRWRAISTLVLIITITLAWNYLSDIIHQKWTGWVPEWVPRWP